MEHTIRLHPLLACIRRLFGLGETDLQYINGPQTLPAPLSREDEAALIERIETDEEARRTLVEHNLRLVVYIAKKFENTAAGIEDLISIGTIGLMKAINTFKSEKQIKLATYASRCIENEILMYIRKSASQRHEMSLDEPLNIDWDGNELLLSDLLGTENDYVYRNIEENEDRRIIMRALDNLSPRPGDHPPALRTARQRHAQRGKDAEGGRRHAGHLAVLYLSAGKAHYRPAQGGTDQTIVLTDHCFCAKIIRNGRDAGRKEGRDKFSIFSNRRRSRSGTTAGRRTDSSVR